MCVVDQFPVVVARTRCARHVEAGGGSGSGDQALIGVVTSLGVQATPDGSVNASPRAKTTNSAPPQHDDAESTELLSTELLSKESEFRYDGAVELDVDLIEVVEE